MQLYRQSVEREIVPELRLFDLGHVAALRRLLDTEGLPYGGAVHVDLVTGVPGGMPGPRSGRRRGGRCCRRR